MHRPPAFDVLVAERSAHLSTVLRVRISHHALIFMGLLLLFRSPENFIICTAIIPLAMVFY